MKNFILFCLLFNFAASSALNALQQSDPTLILPDNAPVKLRLGRTVSSSEAHVGDPVDFWVIEDVTVGGIPVIPRGSIASGIVTESRSKHRLGRGGKLSVRIDFVWLSDNSKIPLRATKQSHGAGHTGLMTGAMIGTGVVLWPAAPVFALMRGQDSTILKGTEVTAYVNGKISVAAGSLRAPRSEKSGDSAQLSPELIEILSLLPSRVLNAQGMEGDMVNVIIFANRENLENAFQRADWVQVDRSKTKTALHMVKERQSYRQMPMSNLYLLGRSQDYGYAIAESMIARRHHLRIWKTDFEIGGCSVWVGAGTHDIGLGKNKQSWSVTHKIDPNVDDERDFIAGSLLRTNLVKRAGYVAPSDPVFEGYNATGGSYHSDGKMLMLELQ